MRRALVLSLMVAAASACPRPTAGPEATLTAYLEAVSSGQLERAYALMSAEYRTTHDRAAFERALGDRRGAEKLRGAHLELEAEVALPDGDRLPLIVEGGEWRIARDPLDFYPRRTPEEALRSFIRAVEGRRYEVVLRFVPDRYRATTTVEAVRTRWEGERRAELERQLELVRSKLGLRFELGPPDGEARLELGDRKQVRLVREEGLWKVEALE